MLRTLHYSIFNNYPEIDCRSLWISDDKIDGSIAENKGVIRLNFDLEKYGLDEAPLVFAQQVHGQNIKLAHSPGVLENCDGIISSQPGLAPVIRTADCAAVMIFDPVKNAVANVHVGWRGAKQKIISNGLRMLFEEDNCRPSDLIVAISPFIKSCCYEVGNEFKKIFTEQYLPEKGGKLYFDLEKYILDELMSIQIKRSNIELNDQCTYCSELQFPSYRRTGTKNRLLNMIKIKE
jgi:YfiH family protein